MKKIIKRIAILVLFLIIIDIILSKPKKVIPKNIKSEVEVALEHFPELKNIPIEFKFKKNIEKSVMQAQPTFKGLFKSKENRSYRILISEKFKITGEEYSTTSVPKDVLIGWIGHELGHVMDYQNRSGLNLVAFGFRYAFLKEYVKKAERAADSFAVLRGMADYIIKTKRFILDHADIDPLYKERIKEYYLSPDEIMEMVKEKKEMAQN
ncbi:hypothetical protein [Allomuricauda sp. CP2A]|uniref:hypothetical protein n=1 Tax=Allomuricauda sp. CP2A TaxID=1848189 RepID=UPI0009F73A8B|nr:hypothetical protein [Muricauda sp. CP2A]